MTKRYLMWTLGTFFMAIFLLTAVPVFAYPYILGAIVLLFIPAIVIRYPIKKTVLSCMAAFLLAMLLFFVSNRMVSRIEERLVQKSVHVTGEIAEVDMNSAGTLTRYKVHLYSASDEKIPVYQRFYIYVYTDAEGHSAGEFFEGDVEFFESSIDYGFGREDRVFVSGYQDGNRIQFKANEGFSIYQTLSSFRNTVLSRLKFGETKTIGLLKAICFGDKDSIDYDLYVSLRRIGLSHVMAVSGLHLSFAVLLFGFVFLASGVNYRIRYIIGIFISIFFTIVVGMPLSCLRACVMLCIFSVGMAFDWFSDSLTSLSVAAFLVLIFNPFAVRDVGFLLSLSATFGIIVLQAPIEAFLFPKKLGKDHRIIGLYRKFTGIFSCSVAAMVATLPITIIVFRSVSLISPFANVLLIYPLQLMFMLGILSVALGWIPGFGVAIGFICDILYIIIDFCAQTLGKLSFASVSNIDLFGIIVFALFLAVLAVSLFLYIHDKVRVFIPLFSLFLGFVLLFNVLYTGLRPETDVKVAFIDVGQGDCTIISKGSRAVIIDYGGSSANRYNLINYMRRHNIDTVELLALTHLHNDHTNGIKALVRNAYVNKIIYPPFEYDSPEMMRMIMEQNSVEISESAEITVLGDVRITIIADAIENNKNSDANERCICYLVQYGNTGILITGDLDGGAEMKLLDYDLSCTILKVGHHGSETSSFYPFLKDAAPEIAVISVGENSYGLPKESVINRLKTICPDVESTMLEGTICYKTDGLLLERINE